LFLTPPRRWPTPLGADAGAADLARPPKLRATEIPDEEVDRFQAVQMQTGVRLPLCHASYLINLASPDPVLWQRSVAAFVVEMLRAERLGIPAVVIHPGSYTTSSEAAGLAQITRALDQVAVATQGADVVCLLETTAGQGSNLGHRFEHLAKLLSSVQAPERFAVCLDTCHVFAAGYPLATAADYRSTMEQLQQTIGLERVRAIHLNDSQQGCGSRKDRHAHIGHGQMGLEPFRRLLNDEHFARVPMYLETPKEACGDEAWDQVNLRTLRALVPPTSPTG